MFSRNAVTRGILRGSRDGAVFRSRRNLTTPIASPHRRTTSSVAALGLGTLGGTAYYCYNYHPHDVAAVVRALRLMSTCFLIVADYKIMPLFALGSTDDCEWEKEYAVRLQAFQTAQERFASLAEESEERKVEASQLAEAKQTMEASASALAEARTALTAQNSSTSQRHHRVAQRILRLCQTNRGIYIKIGQHLANLDYLLPLEYIACLQQLYNDNPTTPFALVQQVLNDEGLGDAFATFDPVPIASASLAQVHTATLTSKNDKKVRVAVKVQHAPLLHTAAADLRHLLAAASLIETMFPQQCPIGWLADEIAPHVRDELDFAHEGRNAERAAKEIRTAFGDAVVVPSIHWQATTARVLTMEYMEGRTCTEVANDEPSSSYRHQVAQLITRVLAHQMFVTGYAHCDPHAANILVRRRRTGKPQIVLLDHGLYRTLEPDFRRNYALLWKSLLTANVPGIYQACDALGVESLQDGKPKEDTFRLLASVVMAKPVDDVVAAARYGGQKKNGGDDAVILRGYAQLYLPQIVALLDHIPRPMLMMLKLMDCVRHLDCMLRNNDASETGSKQHHLLAVTGRCAAQAIVQEHKNPLVRLLAWVDYYWHVEVRMWLVRRFGGYVLREHTL